jgi:hypothetical protein
MTLSRVTGISSKPGTMSEARHNHRCDHRQPDKEKTLIEGLDNAGNVPEVKIALVGHPRSGTNSLVEIIQCQPGLRLINEPFCTEYTSWNPSNIDYRARLAAGEPFSSLIDEVFGKFDGIKELSYQLDGDLLRQLVHRPDVRVVTLRRRNLLEAAVSFVLAERTGLWKRWDAEVSSASARFGQQYPTVGSAASGAANPAGAADSLTDRYLELSPLDIDTVRAQMTHTAKEIERIDEAVAGVDTLRLTYEDLYFATPESRLSQVAALWDFLGMPAVESPRIEFFLSSSVRQAGGTTYGRVPGIELVEAALGSDATGHLEFL